jgi:hypothetical protein
MARYDPYDRGDNPWRSDIDLPPRLPMPATAPRAARAMRAAPVKKKPPVAPTAPTADPWAGRGPEVTAPIAEDRYDRFDGTGGPLTGADRYGKESERLGIPFEDLFPPRKPEMVLNPDERNRPPLTQSIGDPGFRPPRPAADMQFGMGDPGFRRVAAAPPGQITATGDNPILRFLAGLFSGTANAR